MKKKSPEISPSQSTADFLAELNSAMLLLTDIENKKLTPNQEQAALAFAAKMLLNEMDEHGFLLNIVASCEDSSRNCLHRLHEWTLARLNAFVLLSRKEIPDGEHPDREFAKAAFFAATFWEQNHQSELQKLSPKAKKKFARELSNPTRSKWNCPQLDMWLVSIWPIVTTYDWTYRDAWIVAASHPDFGNTIPKALEEVDVFVKHCRGLNLRLTNQASKKTGRVKKNEERELPFMAKVALKCRAILPADSHFAKEKSRK